MRKRESNKGGDFQHCRRRVYLCYAYGRSGRGFPCALETALRTFNIFDERKTRKRRSNWCGVSKIKGGVWCCWAHERSGRRYACLSLGHSCHGGCTVAREHENARSDVRKGFHEYTWSMNRCCVSGRAGQAFACVSRAIIHTSEVVLSRAKKEETERDIHPSWRDLKIGTRTEGFQAYMWHVCRRCARCHQVNRGNTGFAPARKHRNPFRRVNHAVD